jgi:regulator of protease activity HflC (stomatin/prohibitin superfamily)
MEWIIIPIILVLLAVVALAKSITVVHQAEKVIIERFGRYKETLDPGLKFIVPFIDNISARIDMRETA